MPVVLPRAVYDRWLDPAPIDPRAFADLLVPAPTGGWSVDEVTTKINKPDFDEPFE
jgi:putative SOS response-associated peptidase YedK